MSDENNQVNVSSVRELPYAYIPFHSVAAARIKYPDDKLYVYEGRPKGWRIVAVPVLMKKPEEVANEE